MQKILKNNRGSITLFVVLSVLFFLVIVTSVAVSLRNKESAVDAQYERVKAAYEKDVGNEKALYEEKAQYGTVLLSGKELNAKMKQFAGNSAATYETEDTNISAIKRSETLPDKYRTPELKVSTDYSAVPVYMWFDNGTIYFYSSIEKIKFNKDSSYMFNNIKAATTIEIADFDTSSCEDMSYLFHNCLALTELDVSTFNTELVTNMSNMFSGDDNNGYAMNLTKIDGLTSFNTKNVIDMSSMFRMDSNINSLNVSSFNTSNVKDMSFIFGGSWPNARCYMNLREINGLDNFNTSNVETMYGMFYLCHNLTTINIEGFDTSKVNNMREMFVCCNRVTELNISNFNTSNVTTMWRMFWNCEKLENLDLSSFDMRSVTNCTEILKYMNNLIELKTPKIYPSDTSLRIILPKTMYDYGENEYTQLTNTSPTKTELRSTKF